MASLLVLAAAALVLLPAATASHTPNPTSVTIAGSLQSEAGCAGDWDPACAATHLTLRRGRRRLAGHVHASGRQLRVQGGAQQRVGRELRPARGARTARTSRSTAPGGPVKFYYDHKTHWATDNKSSVIAVAPGSFQSELGCPGDWDPSCLRSWLEDPDGDGTYTFETTALPVGRVRDEGRDQRELGRELRPGRRAGRREHPVHASPYDNAKVTFSYVAATHVLTVT